MGTTDREGKGSRAGGEFRKGQVKPHPNAATRYVTRPTDVVNCPIVQHQTVAHLGTLDRAHKGTFYSTSYEGRGLSVSDCPDAWRQIARLGGSPVWDITRADNKPFRFLDAHEADSRAIERYATDNGYAKEVDGWRVEWEDGETDEINAFTFNNEADALDGADAYETIPIPFRMLAATETLQARTGAKPGDEAYAEYLAVVWAEDNTNLDGVWWDDELDPYSLSAPRGTLFERAQTETVTSERG